MALEDANKAIEWDKNYIKAYYRRACANLCLLKLDDAMKDFQELIKLFPNDPKLIENINKTKKQIKKILLEIFLVILMIIIIKMKKIL